MKRLMAKLGFVHRALWQRDRLYCWAVLLGPPPLAGCVLAAFVWAVLRQVTPIAAAPGANIPWAAWQDPTPVAGQPFAEAPTMPLPPSDENGGFRGFHTGWRGTIQPLSLDASMTARVAGTVLATYTLDDPVIPLDRLIDAGPPTGLFVGIARGLFVVREPGLYAFSVALARSSPVSADCLIRFGSAHHPMVGALHVNANGNAAWRYPATEFRLEPGLVLLTVQLGCWRGDHMLGPGEVTMLVRHPGEAELRPVPASELLRAAPPPAAGVTTQPPPATH